MQSMRDLAIFYDLETSDRYNVGQILNCCFIAVADNFDVVDELTLDIKLSRLQLPSPGAILTNKVSVLEHQKGQGLSEFDAMRSIAAFLQAQSKKVKQGVNLIGYNSTRFDLPFLRTSLIRNGFEPYIPGLFNKDMLHLVQKLEISSDKFPRTAKSQAEPEKLSLSLEHVCGELGLLSAAQTHYSRDDVLITIELAKKCKNDFGLDIRHFRPFEPEIRGVKHVGDLALLREPNYDLTSKERFTTKPLALIVAEKSQQLWLDLARYKEGQGSKAIRWFNAGQSSFFTEGEALDAGWQDVAQCGLREFKGLTVSAHFGRSDCDIEQDIYRLDAEDRNAVRESIRGASNSKPKNKDAQSVATRFKIANYNWGQSAEADRRMRELLKQYALYRYGGRLKLQKTSKEIYEEGTFSEAFHPTLSEMMAEIELLSKNANHTDLRLLKDLETYYRQSDIFGIAGAELMQIKREKLGNVA